MQSEQRAEDGLVNRYVLHYTGQQVMYYQIPEFSQIPRRIMSLSLWMRREASLSERVLWHYGEHVIYKVRSDGATIFTYHGTNFLTTGHEIVENQWTHITILLDTDMPRYQEYIDGVQTKDVNLRFHEVRPLYSDEVPEVSQFSTFSYGVNPLNTTDADSGWKGDIRDPSIWNRWLSEDEIGILAADSTQNVQTLLQTRLATRLNVSESQSLETHNHFCFGIRANESRVCSGYGACLPPGDICECHSGRTSERCQNMVKSNCPEYFLSYYTGETFSDTCGSASITGHYKIDIDPNGRVGSAWTPSADAANDFSLIVDPITTSHLWNTPITELSIAFWIKATVNTGEQLFFSFATPTDFNHILLAIVPSGGLSALRLTIRATNLATPAYDHTVGWTHYVITWNTDGKAVIYRNGVSVATSPSVRVGETIPTTNAQLLIFNDMDCRGGCIQSSQSTVASLDELIVYNRSLSSIDASELYAKNGVPFHTCDNKYPNHETVCSTRGPCVDQEICACEPPYTGVYCEEWSASVAANPVYTFGSNLHGKNGIGSVSTSRSIVAPEQIKRYGALKNETVDQIACGEHHCVISTFGPKSFSFGLCDYGQCGLGDRTSRNEATEIESMRGHLIQKICASHTRTLLLSRNWRTMWTFGESTALGVDHTGDALDPLNLTLPEYNLHDVVDIACGRHSGAALSSDGSVYTWGGVGVGSSDVPLGTGDTSLAYPTKVSNLEDIISIVSGNNHLLALSSSGAVWSWGRGAEGQNGLGGTLQILPAQLDHGLRTVLKVYAGADAGFIYGSNVNGTQTLLAFGRNTDGQLGLTTTVNQLIPAEVDLRFWQGSQRLASISQLSSSSTNTYVVTEDGSLFSTGNATDNALGKWDYADPTRAFFGLTELASGTFSHDFGQVAAKSNGALISSGIDCQKIGLHRLYVCNGHGDCARTDECRCDYGFSTTWNVSVPHAQQQQCTDSLCFGIIQTNSNTCSGHGVCSGVNNCTCTIGYSGRDCANFTCWDVDSWNQSTCSSNGKCVDYNDCQCYAGYSGQSCSDFSCFDVRHQDSSVCTAHGICFAPDSCKCESEYWGPRCEFLVSQRPIVVLEAPTQVGPCDSIILDASRSVGQSLKYHWNVTSQANVSSLIMFLSTQNSDRVEIPSFMLKTNNMYCFIVGAADVNNRPSEQVYRSVNVSKNNSVSVVATTRTVLNVARKDSIRLSGVSMSNVRTCIDGNCTCSPAPNGAISYSWSTNPSSLLTSSGVTVKRNEIFIDPFILEYGNFTFTLQSILEGDDGLQSTAHVDFTVNVLAHSLVAQITETLISRPVDASFIIDGTPSYDPDQITVHSEAFTWSCTYKNGSSCSDGISGIDIILDASAYSKSLSIPSGALPVGAYDISLHYSKVDRKANASVHLEILSGISTQVAFSVSPGTSLNSVNPSEIFYIRAAVLSNNERSSESGSWSQIEGPSVLSKLLVSSQTNDRREISFAKNSLQGATWYTFQYSVLEGSQNSISQVRFKTAPYPSLGSLAVFPEQGIQSKTAFTLRATGWRDDPDTHSENILLQYQFEYEYLGETVILVPFSSSHTLSNVFFPFASSQLKVRVLVRSTFGAITASELMVRVDPVSSAELTIADIITNWTIHTEHFSKTEQLNYLLSGAILMNNEKCSSDECISNRREYRDSVLSAIVERNTDYGSIQSREDRDSLISNLYQTFAQHNHSEEISSSSYESTFSLTNSLVCDEASGSSTSEISRQLVRLASRLIDHVQTVYSPQSESFASENQKWQAVLKCLAQTLNVQFLNGEVNHFDTKNYGLLVHKDIATLIRSETGFVNISSKLEVKPSATLLSNLVDESVSLVMLRLAFNPRQSQVSQYNETYRKSEVAEVYLSDSNGPLAVNALSDPIEIRFRGSFDINSTASAKGKIFQTPTGGVATCMYFDDAEGIWKPNGMQLNYISYNTLSCLSNHTTLFAMYAVPPETPVEEPLPEEQKLAQSLWWLYMVLALMLAACVFCLCITWIAGFTIVGGLCLRSYKRNIINVEREKPASRVHHYRNGVNDDLDDDEDGYHDEHEEQFENIRRYFIPAPIPRAEDEASLPNTPDSLSKGEYGDPMTPGEHYWKSRGENVADWSRRREDYA